MRLPRTAAAVLLLALLPLAACGDDDDGGSAGGELTKAEYIEAANKICERNVDAGGDLDVPEEGDAEGLADYLADAGEIFQETRDSWAALDPPADADEVHEGQLAQFERFIEALADAQEQAEDGDIEGAAAVVNDVQPDLEADQAAADYGLEDCGTQDPSE